MRGNTIDMLVRYILFSLEQSPDEVNWYWISFSVEVVLWSSLNLNCIMLTTLSLFWHFTLQEAITLSCQAVIALSGSLERTVSFDTLQTGRRKTSQNTQTRMHICLSVCLSLCPKHSQSHVIRREMAGDGFNHTALFDGLGVTVTLHAGSGHDDLHFGRCQPLQGMSMCVAGWLPG